MNKMETGVKVPIIETKNIYKNFGSTVALSGVNMKIYSGVIAGLIGENGSGKSTISSIIAGMQPATRGEMFFKGNPHAPKTMLEAGKMGIGMIVQEQGYISGVSIAQNIFIGEESRFRKMGFISKKAMVDAANKVLANIGFSGIDASMYIDDLNIQDRKLIEIAKVMANNPDVLIVDETTTALSQQGRDIIYGIMRKMRDEGKAVILISHDLDELMDICDCMTVLRDGELIVTLQKSEFEVRTIKHQMVGRDMGFKYYREDKEGSYSDEVVIDMENVTTGEGLLMNMSLKLHRGEILGIGGLSHCGMHELGKAVFGESKLLTGKVTNTHSGESILSARDAMKHGMGYVSKDRDQEALVLSASIKDNIASAGLDIVNSGIFILPRNENEYVNKQVEKLSIKCASIDQNVQYLSGGNKQKVVFGKWVGRDCDILVLDCPTRGVDVGVKAAMYQLIEDMKAEGKSIIMISEELTELIGMSDRMLILKDGSLVGEFMRGEFYEHDIIECMI